MLYNAVRLPYQGYSEGLSASRGQFQFPFDWQKVGNVGTSLAWHNPLAVPRTSGHFWHWRPRTIGVPFSLTGGGFTVSHTLSLVRKWAESGLDVEDEEALRRPGIREDDQYFAPSDSPTLYTASLEAPGWNGHPDSTLELITSISIFRKHRVNVDATDYEIPHMLFQDDGTIVAPSVHITGSLAFTTPNLEFVYEWTNTPTVGALEERTAQVFPDHDGGEVTIYITTATELTTAFSLVFSPDSFWSWSGKFDEATGEKL